MLPACCLHTVPMITVHTRTHSSPCTQAQPYLVQARGILRSVQHILPKVPVQGAVVPLQVQGGAGRVPMGGHDPRTMGGGPGAAAAPAPAPAKTENCRGCLAPWDCSSMEPRVCAQGAPQQVEPVGAHAGDVPRLRAAPGPRQGWGLCGRGALQVCCWDVCGAARLRSPPGQVLGLLDGCWDGAGLRLLCPGRLVGHQLQGGLRLCRGGRGLALLHDELPQAWSYQWRDVSRAVRIVGARVRCARKLRWTGAQHGLTCLVVGLRGVACTVLPCMPRLEGLPGRTTEPVTKLLLSSGLTGGGKWC